MFKDSEGLYRMHCFFGSSGSSPGNKEKGRRWRFNKIKNIMENLEKGQEITVEGRKEGRKKRRRKEEGKKGGSYLRI